MKISRSTKVKDSDIILCMSNVRGERVKTPHKLPFSFYFSYGEGQHDVRVRPVFDPHKLSGSAVGTLKLCDDWEYRPGPNDSHINSHARRIMIDFFKTYRVLFYAVWDGNISDSAVLDWLLGDVEWDDMIKEFDWYSRYEQYWIAYRDSKEHRNQSEIVKLENFCRLNNLVNLR